MTMAKPVDEIISMVTPLYPTDPMMEERMTGDLFMHSLAEESMVCKKLQTP